MSESGEKKPELGGTQAPDWGEEHPEHFGYASDEERRAMRGLEDWELVEKIPESQRKVPYWFIAVIVVVTLVAVGLSLPFWGDRPGYERVWFDWGFVARPGEARAWFDWGFVAALVWIVAGFTFVYYMANMYGSKRGGRLDSDADKTGHDDEN